MNEKTPMTPEGLLAFLTELGIKWKNTPHPPVFTAEEGEKYWRGIDGMHCKNLFCKDAKGKLWLIVAPAFKRVSLKNVPALIGSKRLSFANETLLYDVLGVRGGSVTPFAVINDSDGLVQVVLDKEMTEQLLVNYHPLTNTATTTLTPAELLTFLRAVRHEPIVASVTEMP